jgi:hypothetical protein
VDEPKKEKKLSSCDLRPFQKKKRQKEASISKRTRIPTTFLEEVLFIAYRPLEGMG